MKSTIYLIRHGAVYNPKGIFYGATIDVPLSDKGKKQITRTGNLLKKMGVKPFSIYSSDHTRAIQSATILRDILNPEIEIKKDQRLRDVLHLGLEKYNMQDFEKTHKGLDFYKDYIPEIKNIKMEKSEMLVKRMKSAVSDIREENEGKTSIVIVHGYPSAYFLWNILKNEPQDFPRVEEIIKEGIYLPTSGGIKLEYEGKILAGSQRLD